MITKRTKEEKRKLIKEFTKEHKLFVEEMIKRIKEEKNNNSDCCPIAICSECPFSYKNSVDDMICSSEFNLLGIYFCEYQDKPNELINYLQEIIDDCYDEKSHKKENKNYNIERDNLIKKYTLTDKVKRREIIYGEILFTNISFIVNGGIIIIINENKTGGVIYGKKAKKYFRKLSKNNLNYNIKSIKHLSDNGIEQISFSIEENKKVLDNNIYKI